MMETATTHDERAEDRDLFDRAEAADQRLRDIDEKERRLRTERDEILTSSTGDIDADAARLAAAEEALDGIAKERRIAKSHFLAVGHALHPAKIAARREHVHRLDQRVPEILAEEQALLDKRAEHLEAIAALERQLPTIRAERQEIEKEQGRLTPRVSHHVTVHVTAVDPLRPSPGLLVSPMHWHRFILRATELGLLTVDAMVNEVAGTITSPRVDMKGAQQ